MKPFILKSWLVMVLVTSLYASLADASTCPAHPAAAPAVAQLQYAMAHGRFIAYQPTSAQVINGRLTPVDNASVEQDLRVLRPWFDGLITYGSAQGADRIADIAARLKYRAMIIGVWSVNDEREVTAALAAVRRQPKLVLGLSLGNERVYAKQLSPQQLTQALTTLRQKEPRLAITTTEPFHIFLQPEMQPVIAASDFMLVNVHPVFEPWFRTAPDANAAEFVLRIVDKLHAVACGPILVKETGVPTAPLSMGFSPMRQASFYQALQQRFNASGLQTFAYFSAFDAPWRVNDVSPVPGTHPEEAHWGLFDEHRNAKPVMQGIPLLNR